jgi:[ribosomal protein S5]-alanine N-acetyltransferase
MINLTDVAIETERLRLIPTSEAYAPQIFAEFTREITTYMTPKPAEAMEETLTFLRRAQVQLTEGTELHVVVLAKRSGEFLGVAGLHELTSRAPELGIWIKKDAHGHGYGLEAVTAMSRWALSNLDFDYLVYPVDRRNVSSRRIPESLGGAVKGEYDKLNESGFLLQLLEYQIEPSALREQLPDSY